MSRLSAAEADLLRDADAGYIIGEAPSILKHVARHLPIDDPRRRRVEDIAAALKRDRRLSREDREHLIAGYRGASSEAGREIMRVRSFRNVVLIAAAVLGTVAIAMAVVAAEDKTRLPLCFEVTVVGANPDASEEEARVVCPSGEAALDGDSQAAASNGDSQAALDEAANRGDVALVGLLGVIAAAVAAATSLRDIRGTSTPYAVPVALALLKLPTGALTAVLGILLMRAQFFPGLSALDSSAQILGWAVVFGYAQQLFTGVVDAQASRVLDDVRGGLSRATKP